MVALAYSYSGAIFAIEDLTACNWVRVPFTEALLVYHTCFVKSTKLSQWIGSSMPMAYIAIARGSPWVVPSLVMDYLLSAMTTNSVSTISIIRTFESRGQRYVILIRDVLQLRILLEVLINIIYISLVSKSSYIFFITWIVASQTACWPADNCSDQMTSWTSIPINSQDDLGDNMFTYFPNV